MHTNIFYNKNRDRFLLLFDFRFLQWHEFTFSSQKLIKFLYRFTFSLGFFPSTAIKIFHQRPHRPRWPPLGSPICPRLAPWLPPRALPRTGAPPLWLLWRGPELRPCCDGGSWPESQSGVGGGTGRGGEVDGCPAAAPLFFAGAGAGTMDSSRDLLFAGSPSSPPAARSAISFLAATRLAFDVRWTPSPAQMLVPSTVVRS